MGELKLTRDDATAVVALSNPAKRNAITREMWTALPALLAELDADRTVRVILLTGDGGDFSAGNDIGGLRHGSDTDLPSSGVRALTAVSKPVIAVIRGYCLGAGAELSLAADLRLAAADARFGIPPANLGLVFPLAGLRLLLQAVGPAQARRLLYTGDRIEAGEAFRIGLVDEVVPAAELDARALALAQRVASRSQLSIRAAKQMIRAITEDGDADAVTATWRAEAVKGVDLLEGRAAFAEKREPRFTWSGFAD